MIPNDVSLMLQIVGSGGIVWLTWRIKVIEDKLGNGKRGVFMRVDVANEKHKEIERRVGELEGGNK